MYQYYPKQCHGEFIEPTYYLISQAWNFKYFRDYLDSFANKLKLVYVGLIDINEYDYIDDPTHVYIFCQSITKELLEKKFNKILLNTEQLSIPKYFDIIKNYLKHLTIIDYSIENIALINDPKVIHIPYQYKETEIAVLKKYYQEIPKQYDVAYCGTMSPRRRLILDQLKSNGVVVMEICQSKWGQERDMLIASCKMLINIHHSDNFNVYESFRCDRWAFAQMPVVSEDSIHDDFLDMKYYSVIKFCPYDKIVDTTLQFLSNVNYPTEEIIETIHTIRYQQLDTAVKQLNSLWNPPHHDDKLLRV
ncbi:hypothetical protein [Acanthamoeba castellanii mimivirus]|uniref:Uncharacterized protein L140 n=5 Tax=Mimivirus TaxID=315393 RepID=YL140_MIMIV|nr:hypothetical protein MIMI_gp0157 [Acanthamoeba polyphaga mimivirus]Q5UR13.1 RecName: Full=Uncharacterized protein L140 [Acanthamoeba polyphaga mimivirus]AEQ60319.1 putative glycosyltransferase [Acanthamoeba castellanii mamavirus]AHA45734.1 hypothetical protein HIRU_S828 [Hirudovirus strain Sangsue]AHJ39924.1 hypothetical protein [Samba virus]ALR83651.1 putative glycosyltransferase [Niemeyer virus]AMZ02588.1 hypothetical protein [Mimivirus Bombay]EJN41208.1 hypothetical protein lvs_L97 [Ac